MASPIQLLYSNIRTLRDLTDLVTKNITQADVEGYTKKQASVISEQTADGSVMSVHMGPIQRSINKTFQAQVETQNAVLGTRNALNAYCQKMSTFLGAKGTQATIAHDLGSLATALSEVASNPGNNTKSKVVNTAQNFATKMNLMAKEILNLQGEVDAEIGKVVGEFNSYINRISEVNQTIEKFNDTSMDTSSLEDDRDLLMHKATELIQIKYKQSDGGVYNVSTMKGRPLVSGSSTCPISYAPVPFVAPGQVFNPIILSPSGTLGGMSDLDITGEISEGRVAGLIQLRDRILPDILAELDELTRVVRDTVNALHNEGTALGGAATLTGSTVLPDVTDVPPTGATGISGTGTIRIGVTDKNGTLIDYKDIQLNDGMTIGGLIQTVTNANYINSAGQVPAVGGGFTIIQLPTGELQISATTPGQSISIGSVGPNQAKISADTANSHVFDPLTAKGFSHFFGLNNIFLTGNQIVSSAHQIGLSSNFQVNPNLIANSNNLAVGRLTNAPQAPTGVGLGIEIRQTSLATEISDALARSPSNFLAAGQQGSMPVTATSYAANIISLLQENINRTSSQYNAQSTAYKGLVALAHKNSAVDPQEEILHLIGLSNSLQISTKALNIKQSLDQDFLDTMSRR